MRFVFNICLLPQTGVDLSFDRRFDCHFYCRTGAAYEDLQTAVLVSCQ